MKKKIIILLVLLVLITGCGKSNKKDKTVEENKEEVTKIYLKYDDNVLSATLVNNTTTKKLVRKLKDGDITITMTPDGSYEKRGEFKFGLPTNEKNIKTKFGDIMLNKETELVIYFDEFFLPLTKIGTLDNLKDSKTEKKVSQFVSIKNDVEVTISLSES